MVGSLISHSQATTGPIETSGRGKSCERCVIFFYPAHDKPNFAFAGIHLNAAYTHPVGLRTRDATHEYIRSRMLEADRNWPTRNSRDEAVPCSRGSSTRSPARSPCCDRSQSQHGDSSIRNREKVWAASDATPRRIVIEDSEVSALRVTGVESFNLDPPGGPRSSALGHQKARTSTARSREIHAILGTIADIHDYDGLRRLPEFRRRVSGDLVRVF